MPSSAPASSIIQIPPESAGFYGDPPWKPAIFSLFLAICDPSPVSCCTGDSWGRRSLLHLYALLCRVPKEPVQRECSGNNSAADRSGSIHPNASEFLTWSRRMDNYSLALAICYAFTPQGVWIAVKFLSGGKQKVTLKGRVKGRRNKPLYKLSGLCWPLGQGKQGGAIRRQRWGPWLALMWLWAGAFPCLNGKG